MLQQFLVAALVSILTVGGGSLLWPRITSEPRPEPIQKVHDIVMSSPWGPGAAQILGVSDAANVEPINVSSAAAQVANSVTSMVITRAQQVVATQALQQLVKNYQRLPEEQKAELQALICKPPESTPAAPQ